MSSFTRGPWHVGPSPLKHHTDVVAILNTDTYIYADQEVDAEADAANAQLIAAAPTLYETLREIVACLRTNDEYPALSSPVRELVDDAYQMIMQLEGRQP